MRRFAAIALLLAPLVAAADNLLVPNWPVAEIEDSNTPGQCILSYGAGGDPYWGSCPGGPGGGLGPNTVGTTELNDGGDTPAGDDFVVVPSTPDGTFEYRKLSDSDLASTTAVLSGQLGQTFSGTDDDPDTPGAGGNPYDCTRSDSNCFYIDTDGITGVDATPRLWCIKDRTQNPDDWVPCSKNLISRIGQSVGWDRNNDGILDVYLNNPPSGSAAFVFDFEQDFVGSPNIAPRISHWDMAGPPNTDPLVGKGARAWLNSYADFNDGSAMEYDPNSACWFHNTNAAPTDFDRDAFEPCGFLPNQQLARFRVGVTEHLQCMLLECGNQPNCNNAINGCNRPIHTRWDTRPWTVLKATMIVRVTPTGSGTCSMQVEYRSPPGTGGWVSYGSPFVFGPGAPVLNTAGATVTNSSTLVMTQASEWRAQATDGAGDCTAAADSGEYMLQVLGFLRPIF